MSGKLRVYKEKLEGYKKFHQIVKTIKLVALAKYRQTSARAKTRDMALRYTEKAFGGFEWVESQVIKKAEKPLVYIPITTNRGSCGPVNSNLFKYIEQIMSEKTKLMPIGKKGNDSLSKLFPKEFTVSLQNDMKQPVHFAWASYVFENAQAVGDFDRLQLLYSRFISSGMQRPSCINIPNFEKWYEQINDAASSENDKGRYMFACALTNNDETFCRDFYEFHASLAFLHGMCENELAEYAARIIAVEGQLTNLQNLQDRTLKLYNKTRQGSITSSLIEIISAMNAMQSSMAKVVQRENFW